MTGECPFCHTSLPYGYYGECPECTRLVYVDMPDYTDTLISGSVSCYVHQTLENVKDMLYSYVSHKPEFGLYYDRIAEALDDALEKSLEMEEKFATREDLIEFEQKISEFEALIDRRADEPEFQTFFESNSNFFSLKILEVHPKPNFGGELEPDFLLIFSDKRHIIVELETPAKQLYTTRGRIRPTSLFTDAEQQLNDQLHWARENLGWLNACDRFPEISSDNIYGLLMIGMCNELSPEAIRAFNTLRAQVRNQYEIKTFDEILEENKIILENIRGRESTES